MLLRKKDFVAVNKAAERILKSAGMKDVEMYDYRVLLYIGNNIFALTTRRWLPNSANKTYPELEIRAVNEGIAKQEAIQILAEAGWSLVDDENLVLEVERVYETRWDCPIMPEGVRHPKLGKGLVGVWYPRYDNS